MEELEKKLLDRAKNGDVVAFEELIEKHQKKVFNLALRMLGNHEDAYDIAQEVFIKVYKAIKNFKEESSFSTWIYRIATNTCLDELRRRKNKNIVYIDEDIKSEDSDMKRQLEDSGPTPDLITEKKEIKRIIYNAIEKLPDQHKSALILRDIQGFSYEEIARILECPEGTVKSRINRGRKTLKEMLEKKLELIDGYYVKSDKKEVRIR
ncbi:MAG TPA: sigma-70 family RNA polymerase sigma factor [Clostridiaceae bacterium]|nr:sigma-70 family RNA polymerase sigma factor [Clostridiaceae bacterium]